MFPLYQAISCAGVAETDCSIFTHIRTPSIGVSFVIFTLEDIFGFVIHLRVPGGFPVVQRAGADVDVSAAANPVMDTARLSAILFLVRTHVPFAAR
jgi:hypothetical protein